MKPVKILFLTDNFPPESNAPANRTYEHCIEWVKAGADVTVITCNPNFPKGQVFEGYKNKLYSQEIIDGIKVVRVWTYITKNRGTIRRILDYLSFAFTSFLASISIKTDVIIATSPQLFTAVGGYLASITKRKPWIMEVRDLWPESIKAVDAMNSNSILDRLQGLVNFLYRKADRIVVVTDSFQEQIAQIENVKRKKIDVVKNGVNNNRFFPRPPNTELKERIKLKGKFIVGYVGTHGMAHNLDFIMDCAKEISDEEIHFLFIGDGAFKQRLQKKQEAEDILNITMLDPVSSGEVPEYLSLIDISLIPLRKTETFQSVIPSKIFENAAMGKPILLGVEGEAKSIVDNYQAGLCFIPENKEDFLAKLLAIKNSPEVYQKLSKGGLKLAADFSREKLANDMLEKVKLTHEKWVEFEMKKYATSKWKKYSSRKYLVRVVDFILVLLVLVILFMMIF